MRPITGLEGSRIGLMIYLMACPWNFLYVFVSRGYSIGNIKGGKEMSQYDTVRSGTDDGRITGMSKILVN